MIDFTLTEEQRAIKTLVNDFVKKEVTPVAAEREKIEDPEQRFPWDIIEKADAIGLRTLALSTKYGGGGADSVTLAMALEELGAGDYGVAFALQQTWKLTQALQSSMSEAQCQRFLIPFRDDPRFLLAIAVTEPDVASDWILPFRQPGVGFRTTAVRDGDYVVLNGIKDFISESDVAKLYIVLANTDKKKPVDQGSTAFLVPRDTPGLRAGRVQDKMGMRLSSNGEVILEDCRVPMENMLGEWNGGVKWAWPTVRQSCAYKAACVLGVARAAYDKALSYAKTRVQGGKPIIEHPNVAISLADMWTQIDVCRLFIWKAAWESDHPETFDMKYTRVVNPFASQVAVNVALSALEIHGGYGPLRDVGVEKLLRDACVDLHAGGTRDISKIAAARLL